MKRRDIVFGLVIIAVVAFLIIRNRGEESPMLSSTPNPSVEGQIEGLFNTEIPDDIDKAELRDVSGGTATAIATREVSDSSSVITILADLPDPDGADFYQGWVGAGEGDNLELLSLGKLRVAKGGWISEFEAGRNLSDYTTVLVTSESVLDSTPETSVLEGSF